MTAGKDLKLIVTFFRTERGLEPVREWIKKCTPDLRRIIGQRLYELQLTGHLGMPLCKKLTDDLWELRIQYEGIRYRILFGYHDERGHKSLVLLNAFIKKTRTTPKREMDLAEKRLSLVLKDNMGAGYAK